MISSSGSHSLYELTGQLKSVVPDENRTERRTILSHEICRRISDDIKKQARRAMTTRTVLEDKHKAPRAMTTRTVLQDKHKAPHAMTTRTVLQDKHKARRAMTTRTVLQDKHKARRAMTTRTVLQDKHSQTIFQIDTHNTHTLIFNTYRHHNPV